MIRKFLSYPVEKRARLIIWLYDRYVAAPALEELHELALLFEAEEALSDEGIKVFLDLEKPSLH